MWTDTTREKHARSGLRYSSELTDAEWGILEPEPPSPSRLGRPMKWSPREIMNAIL
jgi:putative transposase